MSAPGHVGLGRIVQVAYAVGDVRVAARAFAERLGAGPFFVRHHDLPRHVDHDGAAGQFDHSSAYGQWGAMQVELVEVHGAVPPSLAAIVQRTSGIHHVATFVDSIDDEQRRLGELGWPPVMTAETASGLRYAFHDSRAELGHLFEIYEPSSGVLRLYDMVADAARGWRGDDPVREW
jgi:Glyoxalase/Bleomycin resistance protein/Dioxygenase superfamily